MSTLRLSRRRQLVLAAGYTVLLALVTVGIVMDTSYPNALFEVASFASVIGRLRAAGVEPA